MMHNTETSSKFDAWIFNSFNPNREGLGLYRIFCGLFLLFFLQPRIKLYSFISSLPDDFYTPPPGPMMLLEGFPPLWLFLCLHGLLILSLCLMTAGWKTKTSSIASGFILLILNGFIFSVGKINHEMLIIAVPLLMAFSGWGGAYSVDSCLNQKKKKAEGWTLTLLALIVGFMFFTAGFSKIIGGWLNIDSHATLGHFFKQYFVVDRQDLMAGYALEITNPVIWELFDYATVLFEAGFLLAVFHPRTTRIFVSLAVLFHFATMLILNISFLPNFIAYAAFLNWDWIDTTVKQRLSGFSTNEKWIEWLPPIAVVLILSLIFLLSRLFAGVDLLASDWGMAGVLVVCCAVPVAVYFLLKQIKVGFKT